MTAPRQAMLYMATFALLWAVVEALAAGILRAYSPYQVVFTRYVVHMLLMLAVWGWREPASLLRTRRPLYQLGRSMLMLVMPASWIMGMQHHVDGGAFMILFWLSPLAILALGALLLGERVPLAVWLAAAAAYAGALIFVRPAVTPPRSNWIFPIAMAGSFSLYVVMTRSLRSETTRANLFWSALGVAAALAPVMLHVWRTPSLHDLVFMVGVGVLGYGALLALDHAASAAPVGLSAAFVFVQLPIFTGLEAALGRAGFGRAAAVGTAVMVLALGFSWTREPLAVGEVAT